MNDPVEIPEELRHLITAQNKPIFICYNSEVSCEALALCMLLEKAGYSTWAFEPDVPAGSNRGKTEKFLITKLSCAMIVLLSPATLNHVQSILSELTLAGGRCTEDKEFRVLYYTIGITYKDFTQQIAVKQPELNGMIAPFTKEPFGLDHVAVAKRILNFEQLKSSSFFIQKLLSTDLRLIPKKHDNSQVDDRISILMAKYKVAVRRRWWGQILRVILWIVVTVGISAMMALAWLAYIRAPIDSGDRNTGHTPKPIQDQPAATTNQTAIVAPGPVSNTSESPQQHKVDGPDILVPVDVTAEYESSHLLDSHDRSEAQNKQTLYFSGKSPESEAHARFVANLPAGGSYEVSVRYSNDQAESAPADRLAANINENELILSLKSTGTNGSGWNSFQSTSSSESVILPKGPVTITLRALSRDEFGFEIDPKGVTLKPVSPSDK